MAQNDFEQISSLAISDLKLILDLAQVKSIRELARRASQDAGNVSRRMRQIELILNCKIVDRTIGGVIMTAEGHALLPLVAAIVEQCHGLIDRSAGRGNRISIGAPSFVNSRLLIPALCRSHQNRFERANFLDLAPDEIMPQAIMGAVDIAIHFGRMKWPDSWTTSKLGQVRWCLVARPLHPLAKKRQLEGRHVEGQSFVFPMYWTATGMQFGTDNCPLAMTKRNALFGTSTAESALSALMSSDVLGFLPHPVAKASLEDGKLLELRVRDWEPVTRELFVAVRSDSVKKPDFVWLVKTASIAVEN